MCLVFGHDETSTSYWTFGNGEARCTWLYFYCERCKTKLKGNK